MLLAENAKHSIGGVLGRGHLKKWDVLYGAPCFAPGPVFDNTGYLSQKESCNFQNDSHCLGK